MKSTLHLLFGIQFRKYLTLQSRSISKQLLLTALMVLCLDLGTWAQNGNKSVFLLAGSAPEMNYQLRKVEIRPVRKEQLQGHTRIGDVILGYPVNWITSYESVEIVATSHGKTVKAVSPGEVLSAEQKNLLNTVDQSTNLVININYTYKEPVSREVEKNVIHVKMTVVPEIEAEYPGGQPEVTRYLKENGVTKMASGTPKEKQQVIVRFVVNEEGEVTGAKIARASGDPKTDKLLLEAITKMPRWKPAEDTKKVKVKQEFEISVGTWNDGC